MTIRLTKLETGIPIVNESRGPSAQFHLLFNNAMERLETAFNGLEDAVSAIAAAQAAADAANAAADNANAAAESITAENSLANSFVENFTPPVVSAANTGVVTIANHDRHYGNGDVVSVTGGTVATGQAAGTAVHIFYSQPSRAGGVVTYQYSTDEADAAQLGDVHSVGAVVIPAAGTASGGYARPPGYGGVEP